MQKSTGPRHHSKPGSRRSRSDASPTRTPRSPRRRRSRRVTYTSANYSKTIFDALRVKKKQTASTVQKPCRMLRTLSTFQKCRQVIWMFWQCLDGAGSYFKRFCTPRWFLHARPRPPARTASSSPQSGARSSRTPLGHSGERLFSRGTLHVDDDKLTNGGNAAQGRTSTALYPQSTLEDMGRERCARARR